MRIRVEGPSTSKSPLVFIHGAGAAATVWLDLFRHFERTRRVVAIDLPAHGQSDAWHAVDDASRIAHYRDAVGVACAHLQIERATLVGHSMGGLIALAAAAAWPDKVAGVVAFGAAAGMKPDAQLLAALAAQPNQQAEILAELGWSPSTPRDTVARWMRTVTSAAPEIVLADLRAVAAYDLAGALPSLSKRTRCVLVSGEDDLLCSPALVARTVALLPGCEHMLVAEAGHHVHLEQPAQAIDAIARML
jgi:pimeloyl-ACP methyl ester carboxylesterase